MPEFITKDPRANWPALRQGAVPDVAYGFDYNGSGFPAFRAGSTLVLDSSATGVTVNGTIATTGAATIESAAVTNNLTVGGTLAVTGNASFGAIGSSTTLAADNAYNQRLLSPANIATGSAVAVAGFTVPNANTSAVFRVLCLVTIGDSAAAYQSTRVAEFQVVIARTTGANAVFGISSAIGGQIATVSGGATFTFVAAISSVSGAVGATNTANLTLNVTPSAGTPNMLVRLLVTTLQNVGGVTVAAA